MQNPHFKEIHEQFIGTLQAAMSRDERYLGLLAGGSLVTGAVDRYSDLDLILVCRPEHRAEIMGERFALAEACGGLLSAFTGEHVGEPRLLICLYGPPALHVDLKFVSLDELGDRTEDPAVLWERGGQVAEALAGTAPRPHVFEPQRAEDRFWVWVHYAGTKLGRGELFEVIDHLSLMRSAVLAPLLSVLQGLPVRGVRRLEQNLGDSALQLLKNTVPEYSLDSCYRAIKTMIALYRCLRAKLPGLKIRREAEEVAVAYVDEVYAGLSRGGVF